MVMGAKVGTAEWYLRWFNNHCDHLMSITEKKNSDYSTGGDLRRCAFDNFEFCEKASHGKMSTEHGFIFRMSDKFTRLINLITSNHGPRVATEKVEDTIDDLIIYLMLFRAYREYRALVEREEPTCKTPEESLAEILEGDRSR